MAPNEPDSVPFGRGDGGSLFSHFSMAIGDWVVMPNHLHGIIILQDGDGNVNGGDGRLGDGMSDGGDDGDADGRGEASGNDIRGSKTRYFPDASPLRAAAGGSRPTAYAAPACPPPAPPCGRAGPRRPAFFILSLRQ